MDTSSAGYRYYKFPEPESYNLNRLLYTLRMKADERQRFVQNMEGCSPVSAAPARDGRREDPRSPEGRQSWRTSNPGLDRRSPRGGRHARSGAEKWIEQARL